MTLAATDFITETQLWNALLRQCGTALPLPSGSVRLTPSDPPDPMRAAFALRLGQDAGLTLTLDDFPFARLTGVDLTLADVAGLPQTLAEGLLLGAVDMLRLALPPALAGQVALPEATGAAPSQPHWLAADIDLGNGAMARCHIGGRRQDFVQVLSRLFPAAADQPAALPVALVQGLSVPVALAAGSVALLLSAFSALEPGDVLLAPIQPDHRSFLVGPRLVRIGLDTPPDGTAPGWRVKEISMNGDASETAPEAISLDDVPLTLRFVTEDRQIALADLQGLAAGALLPMDVAPLEPGLPLRIQANGVTVGEGHLVQIDDRYAVRIARMVPRKG